MNKNVEPRERESAKEVDMLNVLAQVAIGLGASWLIREGGRRLRSGQINTARELEAVLRLHSDWMCTYHMPSGTHIPFVVAPDGSICLARMVNGNTKYYKVNPKLVKQVCAL